MATSLQDRDPCGCGLSPRKGTYDSSPSGPSSASAKAHFCSTLPSCELPPPGPSRSGRPIRHQPDKGPAHEDVDAFLSSRESTMLTRSVARLMPVTPKVAIRGATDLLRRAAMSQIMLKICSAPTMSRAMPTLVRPRRSCLASPDGVSSLGRSVGGGT